MPQQFDLKIRIVENQGFLSYRATPGLIRVALQFFFLYPQFNHLSVIYINMWLNQRNTTPNYNDLVINLHLSLFTCTNFFFAGYYSDCPLSKSEIHPFRDRTRIVNKNYIHLSDLVSPEKLIKAILVKGMISIAKIFGNKKIFFLYFNYLLKYKKNILKPLLFDEADSIIDTLP